MQTDSDSSKPIANTNLGLAQVPVKFQQAFALYQHGQLAEAQGGFEEILQIQPDHVDALHWSGVIAYCANNLQSALALIGKAIELNPDNATFHTNLGLVLEKLDQFDAALASYDQAIALNPDHVGAYYNRGVVLQKLGQFEAALASYDKAVALRPDYADAWSNRGLVLEQLKQFDAALASHDQAVALKPDFAEASLNRGVVQQRLKQFEAALASYDRAIALKPDFAEACCNRGVVLEQLKQLEAALASHDQAIALRPGYVGAHYNRGVVLQKLKQFEAALASYDKVIALDPGYAEAYSNRGNVLRELDRFDAALASYDKAVALKPDYAESYSNRGLVLQCFNRLDAALADHEKAIALKPDYAEAWSNRGGVLLQLKQLDAAVASYDKAIALKPDLAQAYWNKSLALLLGGDFDRGLELYEWRFEEGNFLYEGKRNFRQPLWHGKESVAGKTILLQSEQGLGDALQFCRYASMVARLGARVILEVRKPLMSLMASLEGVAQLVEYGSALPAFDYHCPLLSLPLAFKTNLDTIPAATRYLGSDAGKVAQWETRLGVRTKPRVGLVWSGNPQFKQDYNRSIPLAEFVKLLPAGDFQFISLQQEIREGDRDILRSRPDILFFGDELNDFSDTAALCECVDVVVSTCTSVPHLSCALGRPTWILLSFIPDWRWLLDREDSPWYPTAKLYRQSKYGEWDDVFQRINADLKSLR